MASIIYVARRDIEPTGYSKSGQDISAAASDDSFNSSSTNLSGLLDNQWVLVAGFANAANNGWFQASANSTSTKIAQDTTTALVTESAGPPITIVGYKRGFGQSYGFDFNVNAAERSSDFQRTKNQPIGGGAPEVILYREEKFFQVTTSFLSEAQVTQMREIIASVAAGEQLTFDPYGTIASPNSPHPAVLDSDSYTEQRVDPTTFVYRVSFKLLLLD